MPGRPCAPESGAANDLASAHVAGHGHRFRLGVDQPDYLRLLRCFASFAPAALHASVTRRAASYEFHPSWVSLQPSGTRSVERDPRPSRGAFGAATIATVQIGGFTTNAAADGAEVSTGDVQTPVLNGCFGVAMLGRCWTARGEVNQSETSYCVRMFQDVSEGVRPVGRGYQWLVERHLGSAPGLALAEAEVRDPQSGEWRWNRPPRPACPSQRY